MVNIDKAQQIIALVRDIVIIIGIAFGMWFIWWWFLDPSLYEEQYYYDEPLEGYTVTPSV